MKPARWIVVVSYKEDPVDQGYALHAGNSEEMSRVYEKLAASPQVETVLKARIVQQTGTRP